MDAALPRLDDLHARGFLELAKRLLQKPFSGREIVHGCSVSRMT
jgi:hypothetical protein